MEFENVVELNGKEPNKEKNPISIISIIMKIISQLGGLPAIVGFAFDLLKMFYQIFTQVVVWLMKLFKKEKIDPTVEAVRSFFLKALFSAV